MIHVNVRFSFVTCFHSGGWIIYSVLCICQKRGSQAFIPQGAMTGAGDVDVGQVRESLRCGTAKKRLGAGKEVSLHYI